MLHLVAAWFFAAVGFLVASALLGDDFKVEGGFGSALVVAALFGVLNAVVGRLVFIGLGVATLGLGFLLAFLTRWVASAIVLKLTDALSKRLTVKGFFAAIVGAAIIGLTSALGDLVFFRHHLRHRFW